MTLFSKLSGGALWGKLDLSLLSPQNNFSEKILNKSDIYRYNAFAVFLYLLLVYTLTYEELNDFFFA